MKKKVAEQIELSLTERQKETLKETTGKDFETLPLMIIDGKLRTAFKPERFDLKLTDQQRKDIAEATGRDLESLIFDVAGTELIVNDIQETAIVSPTGPPNGCAASRELITGDKPLIAKLVPSGLREFRDEVLKGSNLGDKLMRDYYEHAEEFAALLRTHPDLREEAQEILLKNSVLLQVATLAATFPDTVPLGLDIYIPSQNIQELISFIDKVGESGSPALKKMIDDNKGELVQFGGKTTQEVLEILHPVES